MVVKLALNTLDRDTFESALSDLKRTADHSPEHLRFDWSQLADVEPTAGLIYTTQLLALRDIDVTVSAPTGHDSVAALARGGLAFALTRFGAHVEPEDSPLREERWGRSWSPGNQAPWRLMFADYAVSDGHELFGPRHATFVNPHWSPRRGGVDHVAHLVERWATHRLPDHGDLVDDLIFAVNELLENIREHAVAQTPGYRVTSLLHVSLDGGDNPHLHLAVADTGPGILATVRRKCPQIVDTSDEEMLSALLKGDLPDWPRARGFGLPRLSERVSAGNSRLEVFTQTTRLVQVGQQIETYPKSAPVAGSVLVLRLPVGETVDLT